MFARNITPEDEVLVEVHNYSDQEVILPFNNEDWVLEPDSYIIVPKHQARFWFGDERLRHSAPKEWQETVERLRLRYDERTWKLIESGKVCCPDLGHEADQVYMGAFYRAPAISPRRRRLGESRPLALQGGKKKVAASR